MWRWKDYLGNPVCCLRLPDSCTVAFGSCTPLWFNGRGPVAAVGDRGEVKVEIRRQTICTKYDARRILVKYIYR